jgi:hypothetical protein
MIATLLLAAAAFDPGSHFLGEWKCSSPFTDMPFALDLKIGSIDGKTEAEILNSNDQRLPDGPIRVVGPASMIEKTYEWQKKSVILADAQQNFFVKNSLGDMDFVVLWDRDDGVSVNLWQYFNDRSPSKGMGGLICKVKAE